MKHQQVSVDYWAMGKAMVTYGVITVLVWIMLRLFNTAFTLPRRLRQQHQTMEDTLRELQRRYPEMNISADDLKNAEKELEEFIKEDDADKEESAKKGDKDKEPKEIEPTAGPSKHSEEPTPGASKHSEEPTPGASKHSEEPTPGASKHSEEPALAEESKKSI